MGLADFGGPARFPLIPLKNKGLPELAQSLGAWSKGYKHLPCSLSTQVLGVEGAVGTVSNQLCLKLLPNLFSSVINHNTPDSS